MSSSQKVSWFKFILLWFVISKWNFLQSALDWLTLSWTFCFYFEADNNVCWHVFCFNCLGKPWSYLYESSNHNTKYMSAKEILSEKGKIPLMCFSMPEFLQALEALGACKERCTLTHSPHPLGLRCASEDHPSLQNSSGLSAAKWSFSLTHSFAGRCVYIKGGRTQRWNVTRTQDKVDSIFLNLGDVSDLQLGSSFDFFFFLCSSGKD